jgi:hypothetical protein
MDTLFFAITAVVILIITAAIIKMIANRLKGKDELDGIMKIKPRKKNNDKLMNTAPVIRNTLRSLYQLVVSFSRLQLIKYRCIRIRGECTSSNGNVPLIP